MEMGLWAPNHKMTQPWKFILLSGGTREKLSELLVKIKSEGKDLNDVAKKAIYNKMQNPTEIVAVGMHRVDSAFQQREDYATMACAIQNISLFLWEKGIGTKWSTGAAAFHPETYEMLDLDPQEIELVGLLMMGNPKKVPEVKPRVPLEQVFSVK